MSYDMPTLIRRFVALCDFRPHAPRLISDLPTLIRALVTLRDFRPPVACDKDGAPLPPETELTHPLVFPLLSPRITQLIHDASCAARTLLLDGDGLELKAMQMAWSAGLMFRLVGSPHATMGLQLLVIRATDGNPFMTIDLHH